MHTSFTRAACKIALTYSHNPYHAVNTAGRSVDGAIPVSGQGPPLQPVACILAICHPAEPLFGSAVTGVLSGFNTIDLLWM
jgi:hypothetical protein